MTFHVISKTAGAKGAKQVDKSCPEEPGNGIGQTPVDDYFTELERWQARREESRRSRAPPKNVIDFCAVRRGRKGVS